MRRIRQFRQQIDKDAKSRWWRDGLFGLVMGTLTGLASFQAGLWGSLAVGVVCGLVAMRCGTAFLGEGGSYFPIWRRRESK